MASPKVSREAKERIQRPSVVPGPNNAEQSYPREKRRINMNKGRGEVRNKQKEIEDRKLLSVAVVAYEIIMNVASGKGQQLNENFKKNKVLAPWSSDDTL